MASLTVSQLMTGKTPVADYEGITTADDMVLAVSFNNATKVDDYIVAQLGIKGVESSLNPETQESQYIRQGKSTVKTGTQRTFTITGDRFLGDDFQDKALATKFETGQGVVIDYVWFNILTGKGEKGKASVMVEQDSGGNAGDNANFSISLNSVGEKPTEYTYTTGA